MNTSTLNAPCSKCGALKTTAGMRDGVCQDCGTIPTPRTDEIACPFNDLPSEEGNDWVVPAEFARTLEREIYALMIRPDEMVKEHEQIQAQFQSMDAENATLKESLSIWIDRAETFERHANKSLDALAKSDQEGFDKNVRIAGLISRAETAEAHLLRVEAERDGLRAELAKEIAADNAANRKEDIDIAQSQIKADLNR